MMREIQKVVLQNSKQRH